jgi:hypothetical protein
MKQLEIFGIVFMAFDTGKFYQHVDIPVLAKLGQQQRPSLAYLAK